MRKTLVLTMTAALVVLMGSSAQATIRDITDPSGDVMGFHQTIDGDETYTRDGRAEGDIVFARIRHTGTQVVIYLRHRQLSVPRQYGGFTFIIQGSSRRFILEAGIDTRHGDPQGESYAYNYGYSGDRSCAHSNHINYAGDSAWMRISLACLKYPKYVRVNASTLYDRVRPRDGDLTTHYDNPAINGGTISQVGDAWTPWVVTD